MEFEVYFKGMRTIEAQDWNDAQAQAYEMGKTFNLEFVDFDLKEA